MTTGALRENRLMAALHTLATDPGRIDRERMRFNESPPPAYSNPHSPRSTLPHSPECLDDEHQRIADIRWNLISERDASLPRSQFEAQIQREREWIMEARARRIIPRPLNMAIDQAAQNNVIKDWKEQGIWNDRWNGAPWNTPWKHEEPVVLERNTETEPQQSTFQPSLFGNPLPQDTPPRPPARQEIGKEKHQHESSRPIYQFTHRLLKEADRLIKLEGASADIYTRAYTAVKKFWVESNIWDERWGLLPGQLWKHELPFEEEFANRCNGSQAYPAVDFGDDDDEPLQPSTRLCDIVYDDGVAYDQRTGGPVADPSHTSNGESSRLGAGGAAGAFSSGLFQRNPSPPFTSAVPTVQNPFLVLSEATVANVSHGDLQVPLSRRLAQRRVQASKVSKAPLRKNNARRGQQLLSVPTAASPRGSSQLSIPNGAQQTTQATATTPRRSSRLQAKNAVLTKASKARTFAELS